MKKIVLWVSVLAICAVSFQSCCMTRVNSVTKAKNPQTSELLADLDVRSEKVSYTYQTTIKSSKIAIDVNDLKDNAVYEALKKVGADVMVAPQFMINCQACLFETTYEITVTGYPAYYTNIRQMPVAEKTEMKELKEGTSYVIVRKSSDDNLLEVDKNIIFVPYKDHGCRFNIDETVIDHVVMSNKGAKNKNVK